jgi:hypothetical protein
MGILKAYYQINFTKTPDLTWSYPISFWGFMQINFAIIAACSPVLKPLMGGLLRLHADSSRGPYPTPSSRTGGTSGQKSRSRGLRTIGGGFMTRSGADGPAGSRPRGAGPYPNPLDTEVVTGSEEIIELTGKVLGDGGDYHASIRGGKEGGSGSGGGSSSPVTGGRSGGGGRGDDGRDSRTGSEEMILGAGQREGGIVMTTEVKVTDE